MRLALVGYGKMGQTLEALAHARGYEVSHRISDLNYRDIERITPEDTDVAIEFTHPEAVVPNLEKLLRQRVPVVVGTTGWYSQLQAIEALCTETEGALVYASNFSIGVQLLYRLTQQLAQMMAHHPAYDPSLEERHHRHKADAPSGTALRLAEILLAQSPSKRRLAAPGELMQRPPMPEELAYSFLRTGELAGEHVVHFSSGTDQLSLSHRAFTREGFALGALWAAAWLRSRRGFYRFEDILPG